MRRWIFRIILMVVALVVLLVAAVQVVLWSDFPRGLILSALQEETGLRIEADVIRTGWAGETRFENLTVALPLEPDPFLTIPRMRISHTGLIKLAILRRIEIIAAEVDRPSALIKPDDRGDWNVLVAADTIARAQGPVDPYGPAIGALPRVLVRDARFDVHAPDGTLVRYEPLSITGTPDDQHAWQFQIAVQRWRESPRAFASAAAANDPQVVVAGRIAPRMAWRHTVEFDVDEIPLLLGPWLPELPEPLRLAGLWQGEVRAATLTGQLTLRELVAADAHLYGNVDVTLRGEELVIEPADLRLTMAGSPVQDTRVYGGRIRTDGRRFNIDRVNAEAMETTARLSAAFDRDEEQGHLRISWLGRLVDLAIDHEGTFNARLDAPAVGRRSIIGTLSSEGASPHGAWESTIELDVSGHEWRQVRGRAAAQRLLLTDNEGEIDLSGFAARITSDWPSVTLTHLSIPDAHVLGHGRMNMDTFDWLINIHARDWILPRRIRELWDEVSAVDLSLLADGRGQRVNQLDARFAMAAHVVRLVGRYWPDHATPLEAILEASTHVAGNTNAELTGRFDARLDVIGTIEPLHLALQGDLRGRDIQLLGERIRPLDFSWRGTLDEVALHFHADEVILAEGSWNAKGHFGLEDRLLELSLQGEDMSIARLIELAELPIDFVGRADASLTLALPQFDLDRLDADGTWTAHGLTGHTLVAAEGAGRITLRDQLVRLHGMTLTGEDGSATGEAWIDLNQKDIAHVELAMHQWRTDFQLAPREDDQPEGANDAASTVIDGSAALRLNLTDLTAHGEMDVSMDLMLRGHELGRIAFNGSIDQRHLHLTRFAADAFGGSLDGGGTIVLHPDRWAESTIDMDWTGVDLEQIALHVPALESLRGISSGHLSMHRGTAARPPEPMRLAIVMEAEDGAYDALSIESLDAEIFLGPRRAIVQNMRLHLADGTVDLWGRVSRHEDELFVHGHAQMDWLDLDQMAHALRLTDEPTPGRLSGYGSAGGYLLSENRRLFGQGRLALVESDIVNLPGIATVYSAMRLDFGTPEPRGVGEVTVRLEGDALEIVPLTYFNRGADIAARLRIENVWLREDSPISGIAGGVVRPLRDIGLPWIDRLDDLLGAVQTDAASVRISGTLAEPEATVVPFAEFTGAIGRVLRGSVN
jgi:hypothetical protein